MYKLEIPKSMARPDLQMPTSLHPWHLFQKLVDPHMPSLRGPDMVETCPDSIEEDRDGWVRISIRPLVLAGYGDPW